MNVGMRTHSSRELTKALDVLNAVGGNKDKIKILGEIKQAQDEYERILTEVRVEKAEVDRLRTESLKLIEEARRDKSAAEKAQSILNNQRATFKKESEQHNEFLFKRTKELDAYKTDLDSRLIKESGDLNLKLAEVKKRLDQVAKDEALLADRRAKHLACLDSIEKFSQAFQDQHDNLMALLKS
jgi:hypothetical protein